MLKHEKAGSQQTTIVLVVIYYKQNKSCILICPQNACIQTIALGLLRVLKSILDFPGFSNPSVHNNTVIAATIILIIAGIMAGLVPALKAANVKPIVALRAD